MDVDVRIPTEAEAARVTAAITALVPRDPRVRLRVSGGVNRPPMERTAGVAALYERAARISRQLGKELPEGDYETLAGYIMDELQFIPKDGEMNEVVFENVKFTVLSVEDRRIEKIKVEITPVEESEEEEDEENERPLRLRNKDKE
jgi:hypothetical protein